MHALITSIEAVLPIRSELGNPVVFTVLTSYESLTKQNRASESFGSLNHSPRVHRNLCVHTSSTHTRSPPNDLTLIFKEKIINLIVNKRVTDQQISKGEKKTFFSP